MVDYKQTGRFLTGQLLRYDRKFYDTVYPAMWGANGELHDAQGTLPLGVKRILSGRIDYVGEASLYDGNATDILISDFNVVTDEYKTKVIIGAAEWNIFDLATNNTADNTILPRLDYIGLKMGAVRRSLDTRMHKMVWAGEPALNFQGLFSARHIPIESISTNLYTMDGFAAYNWCRNAINLFRETSLMTANAAVLVVPSRFYNKLLEPIGADYSMTPYQMLTDPTRGRSVREIREVNELKSDFLSRFRVRADNLKDRLMLLDDTDEGIPTREFYQTDRTPPILQDDGITFRVTSWTATSEVQYKQAFRAKYFDVPTPVAA